jgi:hypothetical protein
VKSAPFVFISHTTADPRDFALAHRLADALQERGARIWIAPDSIPAGVSWEPELVAAVMEETTHFLVVVSAAATAAPWVLKEIDLARRRSEKDSTFRVLPLPIGRTGAFEGRGFLDGLQQVPYFHEFNAQLDAVARAVGLSPPVPQAIQSIVAEKTEGFVGRRYILDRIDEFISRNRNGYLIMEGDPGAGKSAILAEFVRRTGCVAHFNNRALGINRPESFLENVPAQLIGRFGLPYASVPADARSDGRFLKRVLEEAAAKLEAGEHLLVAVDALDEVDAAGRRPGANTLFVPADLPGGVYFVMTTRHETVPLVVGAGTGRDSTDLSDYRSDTEKDIRTYLKAAVAKPRLAEWIRARNAVSSELIEQLVLKSDCNFMYLRYVLGAIEAGFYRDLTLSDLPQGLEGYYEDHWERMGMTAKPLPRVKLKIIYVLAEVTQPVSPRQIEKFCGEDAVAVQEVLDEWNQFIHRLDYGKERCYSIYHASFAEFLHRKDIVRSAEGAGVTIEGVNAMIGNAIFDDIYPDEAE